MTVQKLHKALGKLIEQGWGRAPVAINSDTFDSTHFNILDVDQVIGKYVTTCDGDGFTEYRTDGREKSRFHAILVGDCYEPPKPWVPIEGEPESANAGKGVGA